jgi:hypothetical protein
MTTENFDLSGAEEPLLTATPVEPKVVAIAPFHTAGSERELAPSGTRNSAKSVCLHSHLILVAL